MADLASISHSISTDNIEVPATKNAKKATAEKEKITKFKLPAPPPAPKPTPAQIINNQMKFDREDELVEKRSEVRRKVDEYLDNPYFKETLAKVQRPKDNAPIEHWEATYKNIKNTIKSSSKYAMVKGTSVGILEACEKACVVMLNRPDMMGSAERVYNFEKDMFEALIHEMAIEMSDSWVPPPQIRFGLMAFAGFQRQLNNSSNPKQQPQPQPPATQE